MRIQAIQTGTVAVKSNQPTGVGRSGKTRLLRTMLGRNWTEPLPIFAWLIEHPEGLIVVDTGETSRVTEPGYWGWHPYFRVGLKEVVTAEDEIGPQLRKLGFDPLDVRWVVLTHLHTDHARGLAHFPASEILVSDSSCRQPRAYVAGSMGTCHIAGRCGSTRRPSASPTERSSLFPQATH